MTSAAEQPAPLWTMGELASAVGLSPNSIADAQKPVFGVSIDSRTLVTGDLFVALAGDPGPRFFTSAIGERDGHDFLAAARTAGAAAGLVSRATQIELPLLQVSDTLDALWDLGRAGRRRNRGEVFAITGSSGKTTCKGFLAAALGVPAAVGSLNNFWGVPLCLARTPAEQEAAVYEIGTNQPGEIQPLTELVNPTVALLLNVHPAHIGHFRSIDDLREEKLSINSSLKDLSKFVCEYSVAVSAGLEACCMTFGGDADAGLRLVRMQGDRATYRSAHGEHVARVPGGGEHRALTLAAVLAALVAADRSLEPALHLPAELVPNGRGNERLMRRSDGSALVIVNDSYNANPASMAAALADLARRPCPRFAILGDMGELGSDSAGYHLALAEQCAELDGVYCVGQEVERTFGALPAAVRLGIKSSAEEIDLAELIGLFPPNARVLVKGSNAVFWQQDWCSQLERAVSA